MKATAGLRRKPEFVPSLLSAGNLRNRWGIRSAIQTGAGRGDVLLPDTDKHQYQANLIVSWAVTGYWALTLLFVWWTPWVQISWFPTGFVGSIAAQIVKRRSPGDVHRDQ